MRGFIVAALVAGALLLCACAVNLSEGITADEQGADMSMPPAQTSSSSGTGTEARRAEMSVTGQTVGGEIQNDYIRKVTDDFIARLPLEGKTDAEKVLEAYRELIRSTWFDDPIGLDIWSYRGTQSEPPPFLENRALSPLLFGIGSCEDYAAAMTLVLNRMGFEARYIPGLTISVKRDYIDHAWVVVRLDGEWYHLDPQLEANVMREGMIDYRYFLKTDEWMSADHMWGEAWISYGLAADIPLTAEQISEIRNDYTPPECTEEILPPPREKLYRLPPDKASIMAELERERRETRQTVPPPETLNILPPVFYENATSASGESTGYEEPYGKSFLDGVTLMLYEELELAAEQMNLDVRVDLAEGVSVEEWERVKYAFLDDNPGYYWADPQPRTISGSGINGFVLSVLPPLDAESVKRRQGKIEDAALNLLKNVPRGDRFTQAAAIHDEIIRHIRYDSTGDGEESGSVYGGLVQGRGICDAFARSYQYLLQLRGIPCIYIKGTTPWGTYHSWSAVKLDDGWYYADTTWDRDGRNGNLFHDYLFITGDEMAADHIRGEGEYPPLPSDNLTSNNYYIKKGYIAVSPGDSARAVAAPFLKALEDKPLEKEPKTEFLEIRVEDGAEGFKTTREYFARNTFEVLDAINSLAIESGSSARVVAEGKAEFSFNDSTRVLTLLPKAYREVNG